MSNWKTWSMVAFGVIGIVLSAPSPAARAQGGATILKPPEMAKIFPATVFYRGQSATTQIRNSGGVKYADGFYVLACMVDTSGYSTGIAAKYQAYFISEAPIRIEGKNLAPGAYGVGFIAGNQFVVTDLGAHEVFSVTSKSDPDLKRPMPLEVLPDPAHGFRLYAGRQFVVFER
jgi:hypothetical protein